MRGKSIYADLYVKNSHRALRTPRVGRPWRPRVIAWAGPTAFMRDRFYEMDSWYKARIHKPELLPQLHLIEPDKIFYTLEDRLKVHRERSINIGFKQPTIHVSKSSAFDEETMEKLARKNLLKINLEENSFNDLELVDHCRVFDHLFAPGVYFYNTQMLNILFTKRDDDDAEFDVENDAHSCEDSFFSSNSPYFGNVVAANCAKERPKVCVQRIADESKKSDGGGGGFNTLLMVNMDGDAFTEYSGDEDHHPVHRHQILHWVAANIPDSRPSDEISDFEDTVPYLPPIPFYGTGYHRIAFVLFRHEKHINFNQYFSHYTFSNDGAELLSRKFDLNAFVKHFEENITPSALRFCQMKWDESCDATLHGLGLKSPRYWYEWNERLKPKQKEFPLKPMPFNEYLNMYRPPEKVRREVARKRLELLMSQEEKDEEKVEQPEYPDIFYQDNIKKSSFWIHKESIRRNVGWGPYSALYNDYVNPAEQHTMPNTIPKNITGTPRQSS